jgi:sigma-B regulation protein RsbU (phosphoserine phosphatase)
MSQDFASTLDIDTTLRNALIQITRHIGAEGGALFLLDEAGDELVCHASDGPVQLTGLRLSTTEGVVGRSVRNNTCEMVRDALNDPSFEPRIDRNTGFTTRSILCAPLSVHDQCLGAIELVNKKGADGLFDTPHLHVLRAMASSAALALLNARFAASLVERERDRRELELAAEIQRSLLPGRRPPPFPVAGVNLPARLVSGDFFDFLVFADGRIAFTVGDVSGKGIRAALLMAKTASLYRCLAKKERAPGRLLGIINEEICDTATRGMFITMLVGIYDPAAQTVCIANAGHEPPLLYSMDGAFRSFPAQAPPVGISTTVVGEGIFPEARIALGTGTFYVFTDGVTDARTTEGGELGVEGLKTLIEQVATMPLPDRLDTIAARLAQTPLRDDLTVLAVDGEVGTAWKEAWGRDDGG